jgi:hypothetical protein
VVKGYFYDYDMTTIDNSLIPEKAEKGVTPNLIDTLPRGGGTLFLERLADELGKVVAPRKRGRPKKKDKLV